MAQQSDKPQELLLDPNARRRKTIVLPPLSEMVQGGPSNTTPRRRTLDHTERPSVTQRRASNLNNRMHRRERAQEAEDSENVSLMDIDESIEHHRLPSLDELLRTPIPDRAQLFAPSFRRTSHTAPVSPSTTPRIVPEIQLSLLSNSPEMREFPSSPALSPSPMTTSLPSSLPPPNRVHSPTSQPNPQIFFPSNSSPNSQVIDAAAEKYGYPGSSSNSTSPRLSAAASKYGYPASDIHTQNGPPSPPQATAGVYRPPLSPGRTMSPSTISPPGSTMSGNGSSPLASPRRSSFSMSTDSPTPVIPTPTIPPLSPPPSAFQSPSVLPLPPSSPIYHPNFGFRNYPQVMSFSDYMSMTPVSSSPFQQQDYRFPVIVPDPVKTNSG